MDNSSNQLNINQQSMYHHCTCIIMKPATHALGLSPWTDKHPLTASNNSKSLFNLQVFFVWFVVSKDRLEIRLMISYQSSNLKLQILL